MSGSVAREWKRAVGYLDGLAEQFAHLIGDSNFTQVKEFLDSIASRELTSEELTYVMTWSRIQAEISPVEAIAGVKPTSIEFDTKQRAEILQKMVAAGFDPFHREAKTESGTFMQSRDGHHLVRWRNTSPLLTLAEGYGAQDGFEPLEIILMALVQRDGVQAVQDKWTAHRIAVPTVYGDFQFQFQFGLDVFIPLDQRQTFGDFYQKLMSVSQTRAELIPPHPTPAKGLQP